MAYVPTHRRAREPRLRRVTSSTITVTALTTATAALVLGGAAASPVSAKPARVEIANPGPVEIANPLAASGERIVRIAASKAGTPYVYGATGPGAFDCSGFTQWVYRQAGKSLPRTSGAQAGAVRRVAAGDAERGDLVFFTSGGSVYHVGIYAGVIDGRRAVWHAARPGEGVKREAIWTSSVFYGRAG